MILGENIRTRRKALPSKPTQKDFAEIIGVSLDTEKRWEHNQQQPRADELIKIAAALGCTVSELLGEGNSEQTALPDGVKPVDESTVLYVPLISSNFAACAGNGNCYDDLQLDFDGVCMVDCPELSALYSSDCLIAMKVEGDSMSGRNIHDGDFVICDKSHDWTNGNIFLVCLDGRLMIKGIVSQGFGKLPVLKSANRDYEDIPLTEDSSFCILGRVLRVQPMSFKPAPIL